MPGETVKLQVELVEKNAEARLKALDKLATEMGNRKITLNFDEASLTRWKTATDGMTNAQINAFAKMAVAAENTAQEEIAAANRVQQEVIKAEAKKVVETEKANAKIAAESEKANAKIIAATEKTAQAAINAESKREQAALKSNSRITESTSMFGKMSDKVFKAYSSGAITAEQATLLMEQGQRSLADQLGITALKAMALHRAFSLIVTALRSAVSEMKDMDKALTTIQMVTGMSTSQISGVRQTALKSAKETGRDATDYLSAYERFARAGYRENIEELTRLSLITQNVGDVTEDTASKFLLAADAAWKLGGDSEKLMTILDGVAAIADQNATDISKIAEGVTIAGSAFANAGETMQTFAAMLGATTAATQRSGGEMARGLQTIMFRVRQVKGELDDGEIINAEDISNAAKALDSVGISVLNDNKQLKSFSEIMGELAEIWPELDKNIEKYGIGARERLQNALAGNRRGNVLFALMDNWGMYENMLDQFANSAGTALEKNEKYLDSWEAKTNELRSTWTQFVSDSLSSDVFKGFIDGLTKVLEGLGNLENAIPIIITLLSVIKGSAINDAFATLANKMLLATSAAGGLKAALAGIGQAITSPAGIIAVVGTAISILTILSEKQKQAAKDAIALGKAVLGSAADILTADQAVIPVKMRQVEEARDAAAKEFRQATNRAIGGGSELRLRDAMRSVFDNPNWDFPEAKGEDDTGWYVRLYNTATRAIKKAEEGTKEYKVLLDFLYAVDESYATYAKLDNGYEDLKSALDGDADAIERLTGMKKEETAATDESTESTEENAQAKRTWAENTKAAIKAGQIEIKEVDQLSKAFDRASESIKTASDSIANEKDKSIKSIQDIYDAMTEAGEKKYYGSNAFLRGIEIFFSEEEVNKIKRDGNIAMQKIADSNLDAYFEAVEKGDYAGAVYNLFKSISKQSISNENLRYIEDANDNWIFSMKDLGDAYEFQFNRAEQSIEDFLAGMSDATGFSETFIASMMQSLGMYSQELEQWQEDNKEYDVEITTNKDEVIAGIDEIIAEIDKVPKSKNIAIDVIVKESHVQTISSGSTSGSDGGTKPPGKAFGKRDTYSGIALVNDEYPADGSKAELIISKSTGRAYIANGGKPAIVNLKSDDIVLTASETKSALSGASSSFPAFAAGRTYKPEDANTIVIVGPDGEKITPKKDPPTGKVTIKAEKSDDSTKPKGGGSSKEKKADPTESWSSLKKLIDYLLEKGQDDLEDQLKVLDDQLAEMEAERKAQEESKELEEKQAAVQEALLDLEKAQVERTVRYYNEETKQWEWMADQGAVQKAQEAYDDALKNLNDYLDEQDYQKKRDEIEARKEELQAQFDAYKESWESIVDAIEAPAGDIKALLEIIKKSGTDTMKAQSGGIADLLNQLRDGLVAIGYAFGIGNIGANTDHTSTTADTVFDSGGFAFGSGMMRKGAVGAETVIGPGITSEILNPIRNANFAAFADSIKILMGASDSIAANKSAYVTNNNGGNFYVNGVKIGEDMMNQPFATVMRTISLHVNEAV